MTEADIKCLKENIDKEVELQTSYGESPVARILFVSHSEEYDEHDVLYDVISSNKMEIYKRQGSYVLDFDEIVSVKPIKAT